MEQRRTFMRDHPHEFDQLKQGWPETPRGAGDGGATVRHATPGAYEQGFQQGLTGEQIDQAWGLWRAGEAANYGEAVGRIKAGETFALDRPGRADPSEYEVVD